MAYQSQQRDHAVSELIWLSQELGVESRELAIIAEGNVSTSYEEGTALVKASGANLANAGAGDFVDVDTEKLLGVLRRGGERDPDELITEAFDAATEHGARRPTVETLMHVTMLEESSATHIAHVHPTHVNAILCSATPDLVTKGSLFPDQIVVLGAHPVVVDYVDPGLVLAEEVRSKFIRNRDEVGVEAKIIYMRNHGIIALGESAQEALNICLMANKVANVILGTANLGGPNYLTAEQVARIDSRPDEHYRRRLAR